MYYSGAWGKGAPLSIAGKKAKPKATQPTQTPRTAANTTAGPSQGHKESSAPTQTAPAPTQTAAAPAPVQQPEAPIDLEAASRIARQQKMEEELRFFQTEEQRVKSQVEAQRDSIALKTARLTKLQQEIDEHRAEVQRLEQLVCVEHCWYSSVY